MMRGHSSGFEPADWLDAEAPADELTVGTFHQPGGKPLSDDQMLPMINIVFLLLIFFMLMGALAAPSADHELQPPVSASTLMPEDAELTVVLTADGDMLVDGEAQSLADLALGVIESPPAGAVSIRSDASLAAADVIDVLDVLRSAGVQRVQLVTVAEP